MQTTKQGREVVLVGLALGTTGFTLLSFILFRAADFLPEGIGIQSSTYRIIYAASLAATFTASLSAVVFSAMRRDVWSALASFAPVAVLILFAYSLFGLALFDT